jgi:hypothetical protein
MQRLGGPLETSNDPELRVSVERVLERHHPRLADVGRPTCAYCAEVWPCPSAISAHQAAVLAGGPDVPLADVVAPLADVPGQRRP